MERSGLNTANGKRNTSRGSAQSDVNYVPSAKLSNKPSSGYKSGYEGGYEYRSPYGSGTFNQSPSGGSISYSPGWSSTNQFGQALPANAQYPVYVTDPYSQLSYQAQQQGLLQQQTDAYKDLSQFSSQLVNQNAQQSLQRGMTADNNRAANQASAAKNAALSNFQLELEYPGTAMLLRNQGIIGNANTADAASRSAFAQSSLTAAGQEAERKTRERIANQEAQSNRLRLASEQENARNANKAALAQAALARDAQLGSAAYGAQAQIFGSLFGSASSGQGFRYWG